MTPNTATASSQARPRTSTLDRPTLMRLAAQEYAQFATMLAGLDAHDWARPTDCPDWDVRAMAGHVLGMADLAASIREGWRQQRLARKRGGNFLDALTALQVQQRAGLTNVQLIERFRAAGPRAARGRRRTPGFIRRRTMPEQQLVGGRAETWTLGYLIDTILTRDPWMHRVDISRATGRPITLSAEHDGVLVADIAAEWAARHAQPCRLELTGPAGGTWTFGAAGPHLELDAVELCRVLSGREPATHLPATDLLATAVPF